MGGGAPAAGGGLPGLGGASAGSQSNGLLAGLLGNTAGGGGVTGSGFGLNLPSVTDAGGPQIPQTFTEFNMPSRPGYQMVNMNAIQSPLPQQPTEKHVLSHNAEVLKEELLGYVNAIIERMDRSDALKKFESFQIETASRKTFRQLTEHYAKLDTDNKARADKISTTADYAKKRTETQEQMIKKLQQQVLEIANLNKKLQVLVSANIPQSEFLRRIF